MKKTKIICTMGPNTNDREVMKQLALNGMDIARFNFSHGDHEEQKGRVELLRGVREEIGRPIAMLLDTKGPEIRTGLFKTDEKITLVQGNIYTLTTREIIGDDQITSITYAGLAEDVVAGNTILIDDGLIELTVLEIKDGTEIVCRIVNGGEVGQKRGVNVPNVNIKLPGLTEKDKKDIVFATEQGYDFIAASFVRNAAVIQEIKGILKAHNSDIQIIAKIENAEGISNIDEIIAISDGIMVARGDMGVEIPAEEVPHIQKMIIKKCNAVYKPVITATQMLDSMSRNPRPTRAEVTDVANAIYDGTDCIMLSGETANGKYPVEACRTMAQIAETTEKHLESKLENVILHAKRNVSSAVAAAVVSTAATLNAKAIITPTISGFTARLISKLKPSIQIIAVSPSDKVLRKMQIYWGVRPVKSVEEKTTDEIVSNAVESAKNAGYVVDGDLVVVSCGLAASTTDYSIPGVTNTMRVLNV